MAVSRFLAARHLASGPVLPVGRRSRQRVGGVAGETAERQIAQGQERVELPQIAGDRGDAVRRHGYRGREIHLVRLILQATLRRPAMVTMEFALQVLTDVRATSLLQGIEPHSRILELGASMAPRAPRSAGWNVTVVDHATQQELIAKYRDDPNVNVAAIEPVDYVWRGGPLHSAVPGEQHGTFDVLLASHVIEHIPDPVGFLQSAQMLLRERDGILALAVPDKRWCFDYFKQLSTTGQMLEAHRDRLQRHSARTRFDQAAYGTYERDRGAWLREPLSQFRIVSSLEGAWAEFQAWVPDPDAPYVDCHAWHFTPASFRLLVLELGALGLLDWHIDWMVAQPGAEFQVHLKRGRQVFASLAERDETRVALLKQT